MTKAMTTAEFLALYDAESRDLLTYFARRVLDPQLAADLTAETFARALETRTKFDPTKGEPSAWLYGIGKNLYRDHQRSKAIHLRATKRLGLQLDPLESRRFRPSRAVDRPCCVTIGDRRGA